MPKKRANKKSSSKANKKAKSTARKSQARPAVRTAPPRKAASPRTRSTRGKSADHLAHLEHLIEMMVEKDVVEVEFEEPGARWRVRRAEPQQSVTYAAPTQVPMHYAQGNFAQSGGGMHAPAPGGAAEAAPAEPQGEVFKSPMVGTFYRAGSPEAEAFCKPGDRVVADRTLCIIEAMKVMNEIKAEGEFEIVDVLVKNGESVEFGQPLFVIR